MTFIKPLTAIVLLLIFLPASILQAQNNSQAETNPLKPGSKALLFQISDNFNLDSFSGATFSYKRQVSGDRARRIGLNLLNSYNLINSPDSDLDQEDASLVLNVGASYTWKTYTNPDADIKFYYGYGPGLGFGVNRRISEQTDAKSTMQSLSFVVEGIGYTGVEWFFQPSMSLHAEYSGAVRISHTRIKDKLESSGSEEVDNRYITSFNLGGDGVRFGLSIYF